MSKRGNGNGRILSLLAIFLLPAFASIATATHHAFVPLTDAELRSTIGGAEGTCSGWCGMLILCSQACWVTGPNSSYTCDHDAGGLSCMTSGDSDDTCDYQGVFVCSSKKVYANAYCTGSSQAAAGSCELFAVDGRPGKTYDPCY